MYDSRIDNDRKTSRTIGRLDLDRRTSLVALAVVVLLTSLASVGRSQAVTGIRFANGVKLGAMQDNALTEVSGCAASRVNPGTFWVHNDSGDSARIFAVSTAGVTKGIFNLSGAGATDYEDIAVGPGPSAGMKYIYVGDIGDNGAGRNTKQVYRVPEPQLGSSATTLAAEKFTFLYPDGPRDAETLMVDPLNSDVYVVSKRETSNRVYRFKAPLVDGGTYAGVEVARINIAGLTGGDISADGSRILIKNGGQTYLWLRSGFEGIGTALSRTPTKVPTASEPQGEAVCWDSTGADYYTISEGRHQPFSYFKSLDGTTTTTTPAPTTTTPSGGGGDGPTSTNSVSVGGRLTTGQRIVSSNGKYHFDLQGDGNLVTYSSAGRVVWTANTRTLGGTRLNLQGDGNLVLYTSAGQAVWASHTVGSGASHLIMQGDGNLVLRNGSGAAVWATNTSDGSGGGGGTTTTTRPSTTTTTRPSTTTTTVPGGPSRYDHVVVAVMENESSSSIMNSSSTPYIHSLANQGVRFTASHGVTHPSEPNYLALFSGSTQGIRDDSCPNNFSGANLGSQLIASGRTFKGYSESMPSNGYTGCDTGGYARKHNPWVMFTNLPASTNVTFNSFPSDFSLLPTVSFVVPNLCNDMHDCSLATGDNWLKNKLDAYAQWAKTHNSLLILTWDEDGGSSGNLIPTIFVGAKITPGTLNSQSFNHYGLLRTIEDMYGLAPLNNAASAAPVTGTWLTK